MVSTRRSAAAGIATVDQAPAPASATPRRRVAAKDPQPVVAKRRLRSAKQDASPLRVLPTISSSKAKRTRKGRATKETSQTPEPKEDEQDLKSLKAESVASNGDAGAAGDSDPGAQIFLRKKAIFFKPVYVRDGVEYREVPNTVINSIIHYIQNLEFEIETLKVKPEDTIPLSALKQLENTKIKEMAAAQTEISSLKSKTDEYVKDNQRLYQQIRYMQNPDKFAKPDIFVRTTDHLKGTESAFALLDHIVNTKNEYQAQLRVNAAPPVVAPVTATSTNINGAGKNMNGISAKPNGTIQGPPSPSPSSPTPTMYTALSSPAATPQAQAGFFGNIWSKIKSPFLGTKSPVSGEFAIALTPTPTPVGESREKSRVSRTKNHRRAVAEAMSKTVGRSVIDPQEQAKAEAWAQKVITDLSQDPAALGEKRKRLEAGIKMADLNHFASRPWIKHGGFGIDDELYNLEDNEWAPAWAVLEHLRLEEEERKQPPAKKHKAMPTENASEVTPLNKQSIFDSKGNTASLSDLHPRSSILPSPKFSPTEYEQPIDANKNVFSQSQTNAPSQKRSSEQQAEFMRELRRSGHIPGSGSYHVPETDSDDDSEIEVPISSPSSLPWTQQPPPAPVMAHASLPTPVEKSFSVPPAIGNLVGNTVDPAVEAQRARIAKYTPAKPSRLREAYAPSPSVLSDSGQQSAVEQDIPGAVTLDDSDDESFAADTDEIWKFLDDPVFHDVWAYESDLDEQP